MIRHVLLGGLLAVCSMLNVGCQQMSGFVMNDSGQTYYKKGNYAMARKEFQRAALDNPGNAHYQYNLAQAMRKQGDMVAAEQTYRRAIEIDPRHQPSYHGLADMMVSQGRQQDAVALLETWAGSQPYNAEPNVEVAWLKTKLGDTESAEVALQQAIQANPRNGIAVAQLGDLYERKGQYQSAAALYQRSLQMNPTQQEVRSRLATIRDSHPDLNVNQNMIASGFNGVPVTGLQSSGYPHVMGGQVASGYDGGVYIPQDGIMVSQQMPVVNEGLNPMQGYGQQMGYSQGYNIQQQVSYDPAMNVTPQMSYAPQNYYAPQGGTYQQAQMIPQQHTVYSPDMMSQYAMSPANNPAPISLGQATSSIPMMANADPAHGGDQEMPVVNPF